MSLFHESFDIDSLNLMSQQQQKIEISTKTRTRFSSNTKQSIASKTKSLYSKKKNTQNKEPGTLEGG